MDWARISYDWNQLKGRVKEQWGRLTDDDLLEIAGQREQLLAKIGKTYEVVTEEAERQVREWEEKVDIRTSSPE